MNLSCPISREDVHPKSTSVEGGWRGGVIILPRSHGLLFDWISNRNLVPLDFFFYHQNRKNSTSPLTYLGTLLDPPENSTGSVVTSTFPRVVSPPRLTLSTLDIPNILRSSTYGTPKNFSRPFCTLRQGWTEPQEISLHTTFFWWTGPYPTGRNQERKTRSLFTKGSTYPPYNRTRHSRIDTISSLYGPGTIPTRHVRTTPTLGHEAERRMGIPGEEC